MSLVLAPPLLEGCGNGAWGMVSDPDLALEAQVIPAYWQRLMGFGWVSAVDAAWCGKCVLHSRPADARRC